MQKIKLSLSLVTLLRCPRCRGCLSVNSHTLVCHNPKCGSSYPVINCIPVLINEEDSVFSLSDFINHKKTFYYNISNKPKAHIALGNFIPKIGCNLGLEKNYQVLLKTLFDNTDSLLVLVIGGSEPSIGIKRYLNSPKITLVETDIVFGSRTKVVCDAHHLPFKNNTFDGVIIEAVLEHVADPPQCVAEIYRVLKSKGVVYAGTSFIQQVHGGKYDFTRYTYLGHRRLFRRFERVDDGICCGPGMALAWSYKYFLLSFLKGNRFRNLIKTFTHITAFFIKYFDYLLIQNESSYDAASAFYFIGKKSKNVLSDKEIVKLYRGNNYY